MRNNTKVLPYVLYCICAPALPTRCRFVVGAEEAALLTEPRRLFLCVYALFAPPCAYAPHTRSAGPLSLLKMGTCSSLPGRGRRRRRSGRRRREGIYFWPQVFWKNTARRRGEEGGGRNVDERGITLHPTDAGRAIEVNGCFFELELASALAVGARKWLLFYQSG